MEIWLLWGLSCTFEERRYSCSSKQQQENISWVYCFMPVVCFGSWSSAALSALTLSWKCPQHAYFTTSYHLIFCLPDHTVGLAGSLIPMSATLRSNLHEEVAEVPKGEYVVVRLIEPNLRYGSISSLRISHSSFSAINAINGVSRHPPLVDIVGGRRFIVVYTDNEFGSYQKLRG